MKTLTTLAMAALLWTVPANAQTKVTRFQIPFDFVLANQMMPAGQYEVTFHHPGSIGMRRTTEVDTHTVLLSLNYISRSLKDAEPAVLRFTRHGNSLYFTAAWARGGTDARAAAVPADVVATASARQAGGADTVDLTLR